MEVLEHSPVTQVSWENIEPEIKRINPELNKLINALDPSKKLKLVKTTYPFGAWIVKNGQLQLPHIAHNLKTNSLNSLGLDYSKIPLSLLLNKPSEIFITEKDRIIPLKVLHAGMFFGTFETVDYLFNKKSDPIWNVTAGGRSIFTLPKISENLGLKRLKSYYKLPSTTDVHSMLDHWELFRQISKSHHFDEPWQSHVLFFTKEWFSFKKNDSAWENFRHYLFKQAWLQSRQSLERDKFAPQWQNFIKAVTQRRMQPTPYLMDTLRHLMLISIDEAPAFQPANDSAFAPVTGLQKAIIETYQLKKHFPTVMHIEMPNNRMNHPLYYSLSFPTLLEGSPDSKCNSSTIMFDLKNLKQLIETHDRGPHVEATLRQKILNYLHVEEDKSHEISSSRIIPNIDKRFDNSGKFEFCSTSPFWRGCIMLRNLLS
jgi:hypothetical protein